MTPYEAFHGKKPVVSHLRVFGWTPYEAFHGKKPVVSHLRVFGCISYAHVPKDERKKLDVVAKRCVLLGYGTEVKGYGLFDLTRNKLFYSRDIKFNEAEFGLKKEFNLMLLTQLLISSWTSTVVLMTLAKFQEWMRKKLSRVLRRNPADL